MSRKEQRVPWRVFAISAVLFVGLVLVAWLLFGPDSPAPPGGAGDDATEGAAAPSGAAADQPIPGATEQGDTDPPIDPNTPEGRAALAALRAETGTMDLQLFLIVPGVERLVPVSRTVPAPTTLDEQVQRAVEELISWDGADTVSPVAPQTTLREAWVSPGGIAYLDFERSLRDFSRSGSLGELHTVYGIVATVTESFPEILAVQFLIEGDELETLAGHIDLSRPLLPSSEWVLIESGRQQLQESDEPR